MGSNWAQQFRERVKESEGGYKAPGNFDVDEAEEEEEETELEEPQDEAEEETQKVQESGELELEEPVKPVAVDVGKRAVEMMNEMTGEKEPVKRSSGGNPGSAMMTAIMGLLMLQSLPSIFNTVSSAFQPMMPRGSSSRGYYPVRCLYCGYQCLGYNGMPCPRCGRS